MQSMAALPLSSVMTSPCDELCGAKNLFLYQLERRASIKGCKEPLLDSLNQYVAAVCLLRSS